MRERRRELSGAGLDEVGGDHDGHGERRHERSRDRQLVAEVEDQVTGDGDGGEEAEELPAPPLVPPQARGGDSALRTGSRERGEVEHHADEQHRAPCRDEPRCRVRGGRAPDKGLTTRLKRGE